MTTARSAIERALAVPMPSTSDGDDAWETWTAARLLLLREVPKLLAENRQLRESVASASNICSRRCFDPGRVS